MFGEGPTAIPEGQFTDTGRQPFTPEDIRYTCKGGYVYAFILSAKEGIGGAEMKALAGGDIPGEAVLVESAVILGYEEVQVFAEQKKDALRVTFDRKIISGTPVCVKLKIR